jgi:hypothetical protein
MEYKIHKYQKLISIISNGHKFEIELITSPDDFLKLESESSLFLINEEVKCTLSVIDSKIEMNFNNEFFKSSAAGMIFRNVSSVLEVNSNQVNIQFGNKILSLIGDSLAIEVDESGLAILRFLSLSSKLIISEVSSQFKTSSVSAFTALSSPLNIPVGQREPEFAIGVYDKFDNNTFYRPRDIRQGSPVISTVPTHGPSLTVAELDAINEGVGFDKRTIYFKIVSDRVIEPSITLAEKSALKLKLSLPAGLDTVKDPIYLSMYFVQHDNNSNPTMSVYVASYDFHREDTVNFVDGFMLMDVYCPMIIQESMPLSFGIA